MIRLIMFSLAFLVYTASVALLQPALGKSYAVSSELPLSMICPSDRTYRSSARI